MKADTKSLHIRLTEQEYAQLSRFSQKSGMSKSTYIKLILNGVHPKEQPPSEYFMMMKELYLAARNLNYLIEYFRRTYDFNPTSFFEDYLLFSETLDRIQETVGKYNNEDNVKETGRNRIRITKHKA